MTEVAPTPSSPAPAPFPAVVDIELTSRCNARCSFCPRDQTPHQGLIDERTFTAALGRAVEYRDAVVGLGTRRPGHLDTHADTIWVSFCGMGEPLLHPRVVEYVGRAAQEGLRPIVNTNGALLSPETAEALMEAGLAMACLNVGETGERYDEVYGLPFERTRRNVEHFLDASTDRCIAVVVLVDHRGDPDHVASVREYWSQRGADGFMPFGLVNRAGSLPVGAQADAWEAHRHEAAKLLALRGDAARCWIPFLYPFIGYDGNYYLCSSDWRKEVALGTVFERSLVDLFDDKEEQVCGRSPICGACTHEPTNALALSLARAAGPQSPDAPAGPTSTPEALLAGLDHYATCVGAIRTIAPPAPLPDRPPTRRLIPVRS